MPSYGRSPLGCLARRSHRRQRWRQSGRRLWCHITLYAQRARGWYAYGIRAPFRASCPAPPVRRRLQSHRALAKYSTQEPPRVTCVDLRSPGHV
eukprot:scaffold29499_cov60-Phaeocystis_antarctica.AAC.3